MTTKRAKQIAFQALQLIRQESERAGKDPSTMDDWLFSELDAEIGEIQDIFSPYGIPMPNLGSCFPNGESPKNYDKVHFNK